MTNQSFEPSSASAEPVAPRGRRVVQGAFLPVVALLMFAADRWTKDWAETHLNRHETPIIAGYLDLILTKNRGGAWSLLGDMNESFRLPLFITLSVVAIGAITWFYYRLTPAQNALRVALALVLGGALGNLYDRIRVGEVTDFILMHISRNGHDYRWPVFNVADIVICIGAGIMVLPQPGASKVAGIARES